MPICLVFLITLADQLHFLYYFPYFPEFLKDCLYISAKKPGTVSQTHDIDRYLQARCSRQLLHESFCLVHQNQNLQFNTREQSRINSANGSRVENSQQTQLLLAIILWFSSSQIVDPIRRIILSLPSRLRCHRRLLPLPHAFYRFPPFAGSQQDSYVLKCQQSFVVVNPH